MSRVNSEPLDSTPELNKLIEGAANRVRYVLRLYVTGATDRSLRAVANLRWFCERYLKGRYDLRVIDIYQQPSLAQAQQIVAAPTLVKSEPLPLKRLVGDFSDQKRLRASLGLNGEIVGEANE
ncbi:MAG TPA: circadian clock KaiB family protein [Chthoniobacterales bacterium]|nr:circadian clock KaiB family protein [Chthoniobacterales bacterium]